MPSVYLDREQCSKLNTSYMHPKRLVCPVAQLRQSKHGGYDRATTALLDPLEGKTIVLDPSPSGAPGWFALRGWISGPRRMTNLDGVVQDL